MTSEINVLSLDLCKYEPAIVPAPGTCRISNDLPFRFVQAFGAERVVSSKAAQLAEEVVGVDVMRPGAGHWLCDFCRIKVGENLFKPAQFCQSVDPVGP